MASNGTLCQGCGEGDALIYGWQDQPDKRGTIDILWACASTIFVCVWVMLHLNVPGKHESGFKKFLRKMKWFIMAMLAPELVMLFATGQWAAAHRSSGDMADLHDNWTLVHAFYAESGGFWFEARDSIGFPITAKQLHYLVKNQYIEAPEITKEEIWDKSKADRFAKSVAGIQCIWFVMQIVARAIQHLAITLLELSTLCLMTCTAATLFFWFYKPLDVSTPTVLTSSASLSEILVAAGDQAKHPFRDTPLDFAERLEYTSSQFPLNNLWGEKQRPLPRIPNDRDSFLHSWKVVAMVAWPTASFGALQLIAWNFAFPTREEQMLWRYTCLGNGIVLGIGCACEAGAIIASKYTVSGLHTFNDYKLRWPWNMSFMVAGALYFIARVIVIAEVMVSLRALPASCFVNVNWTSFLPHV